MRVSPIAQPAVNAAQAASARSLAVGGEKLEAAEADDQQVRKTFDAFVGQTFFGQMLQSMRKTVGKPAYFYGGRAEEIFTQQLDQVLGEKMADASAETFTGPMFELFMTSRK